MRRGLDATQRAHLPAGWVGTNSSEQVTIRSSQGVTWLKRKQPGAGDGVASGFLPRPDDQGESRVRASGHEWTFRNNSRFSQTHLGLPNSSLTAVG